MEEDSVIAALQGLTFKCQGEVKEEEATERPLSVGPAQPISRIEDAVGPAQPISRIEDAGVTAV